MKNENLNELRIKNLIDGYTFDKEKKQYRCIFCEETYDEGYIYEYNGKMVSAEKRILLHIEDEHNGVFFSLLGLEKDITGLTDIQKKLLNLLADKKTNKEIAEEMDIAVSTVRTHKFYLQKMKRQAKIFLALMETLKIEEHKEKNVNLESEDKEQFETDKMVSINSLHPFFTQYNLK